MAMKVKGGLAITLIAISIAIGLIFLFPRTETDSLNKSNSLDTKTTSKEFFAHDHLPKTLPKTNEVSIEDTWANQLTEKEIESINKFVGNSQEVTIQSLPNKGYKVIHQGKFRHGVVVQKNTDGSISKYEVGPNGIHDKDSSQTE